MIKFILTAFCSCFLCVGHSKLTSTGIEPAPYFSAACDPKVLPIGTIFKIPQYDNEWMCQTTGGAIKGRKIDLYFGDEKQHKEALRFGIHSTEIQVLHTPGTPNQITKSGDETWQKNGPERKMKRPASNAIVGIAGSAGLAEFLRTKLKLNRPVSIMR